MKGKQTSWAALFRQVQSKDAELRHLERRIAELERSLAEERQARRDEEKWHHQMEAEMRDQLDAVTSPLVERLRAELGVVSTRYVETQSQLDELRRQELLETQRQMQASPSSAEHRSRQERHRPVLPMKTL